MPEFMDIHRDMKGITPQQLLDAHRADVEIQDEEGANFMKPWADPESGLVFCPSEAPGAEIVKRVHAKAGHPADEVYPVPVQA
ncbi:MAG: SCO4226 family nickel-binding protein [Actinomycetota bacterium]|nr:SCO4226 family nickel-binding protein [Actinomycetota bacterium]